MRTSQSEDAARRFLMASLSREDCWMIQVESIGTNERAATKVNVLILADREVDLTSTCETA